jgi:hypothetical protein
MSNARLSEADLMREAKVILMGGQGNREPKKNAPFVPPSPPLFPNAPPPGTDEPGIPGSPREIPAESSTDFLKTSEKIGRAARVMAALAQRLRDTEGYLQALQSQLKSERMRSAKLQDDLDTLRISSQTEIRSAELTFRDAVKQLQEKNHSLVLRCDDLQRELSGSEQSVEGYRMVLKNLLAENGIKTPDEDYMRRAGPETRG